MWNINNPYEYRNDNLRRLGFKSYAAYLKSALWRSIRDRVLVRHRMCQSCMKRASTQVHHRAYDLHTLSGADLRCLTALCRPCHKRGERPHLRQQDRHDRLQRANGVALAGWRNGREELAEPIDASPLWHPVTAIRKPRPASPFSTNMQPRLVKP